MKVEFHKSFERDLRRIRDQALLERVREAIMEMETAASLDSIAGIKAMQGHLGYFRLRIGDYRLGLKRTDDGIRIIRFLSRGDIYRKFP